MPILHTVNKSPYERNNLESCLNKATGGSSVVLYEDGVYGAIKGGAKAGMIESAKGDITFYVLGVDLQARGLDESKLIDGVKVIDYNDFVELTVNNDKVASWL